MFHRGQKIIITESNSKNKAHPSTGDMGYIENLFLFPKHRFILASIIMCSYKKNDARAERKKFIIDVGMTDSMKYRIKAGVNKLFFLSRHNVNLLPSFIHRTVDDNYINKIGTFPQIVGTHGIWTGYTSTTSKRNNNQLDNKIFIPYGSISNCECKLPRNKLPLTEIKAWIISMLSDINSLLFMYSDYSDTEGNTNEGCLLNRGYSLFSLLESIITNKGKQKDGINLLKVGFLQVSLLQGINPTTLHTFINSMHKLNSMAHIAMCRNIKRYISSIDGRYNKGIKNVLYKYNVYELFNYEYHDLPSISVIIADVLYRALFIDRCTKIGIDMIKNYIPSNYYSDDTIKQIDDIKLASKNGSAALYRLFGIIEAEKEKIIKADHNVCKQSQYMNLYRNENTLIKKEDGLYYSYKCIATSSHNRYNDSN